MKIEKAPLVDLANLSNAEMSRLLSYLQDFAATDGKDRYLSWSEFRHRNPKDIYLKWAATKINRSHIQNKLQFDNLEVIFCVPSSLNALLHHIDKLGGGFIGSGNPNGFSSKEQSKFLIGSLMMEEAIHSAQLEGASTTRRVAKDMLVQARKPKNQSERMILNNYLLMQHACSAKDNALSVELILELHRVATDGAIDNNAVSGEFRLSDDIYISDGYGQIVHTPPPAGEIDGLINGLIAFANTNHDGENAVFIHPLVKAIILHFLLSHIHPFGDGNGRTARALFYWFVLKNGYWLFEFLSISKHLLMAPIQYTKAFVNTQSDDNDVTYFLYHQLQVIKKAIEDLQNYIAQKQTKHQDIAGLVANFCIKNGVSFNERQLQIVQKALKQAGVMFTSKEISNMFAVADNTARKDLLELSQYGLLATIKDGKTTKFVAPSDLAQLLAIG